MDNQTTPKRVIAFRLALAAPLVLQIISVIMIYLAIAIAGEYDESVGLYVGYLAPFPVLLGGVALLVSPAVTYVIMVLLKKAAVDKPALLLVGATMLFPVTAFCYYLITSF